MVVVIVNERIFVICFAGGRTLFFLLFSGASKLSAVLYELADYKLQDNFAVAGAGKCTAQEGSRTGSGG